MNIAVVGLGYVGSVTAACFAEYGHTVVGVDVSPTKVDQINSGVTPVQEAGLADLIRTHSKSGRLRATSSLTDAWESTDVFIVSVGTPSAPSGDVNMVAVDAVVEQLGTLLATSNRFRVVVITSTIPPGTIRGSIRPTLERISGKKSGTDFGLAFSPEFLRESTAIADFTKPEKVVIGSNDSRSIDILKELFAGFSSTPTITSPEIAEMVKFSSNAWHALKVAFANEIGRISADAGIDSHEVMSIFKEDKKLNISSLYLTPGFAFGGSCLPKDLRTLTYRARAHGVRLPVLESILPSNEEHLAFALRQIKHIAPTSVLVLGLAFKAGTDDLRESPAVPLVEALIGRGYEVRIFDEEIQMDKLVGANKSYVETRLPHLVDLLVFSLEEVDFSSDLVVVAQRNPKFIQFLQTLPEGTRVLDLAGLPNVPKLVATYEGLTW